MSNRLAGVEGLRALAALAVMGHHIAQLAQPRGSAPLDLVGPGEVVLADMRWGLTLFFVLSGFLLYRPFVTAALRGDGMPSLRTYARNRALRILPAYWAILFFTAFVLGVGATRTQADGIGRPDLSGEFVADLLLIQNYKVDWLLTGIGPAWSLVTEMAFYVLLPLLVLGARRLAHRLHAVRALLVPAGALLLCGLAAKTAFTAGAYPASWDGMVQMSLPVHADLFGVGMIAAVLHGLADAGRLRLPDWWRTAGLVAAALLVLGTARYDQVLGWERAGMLIDAPIGVACGLLILAVTAPAIAGGRPVLARFLTAGPVVWVGLVSYSLYLVHVGVLLWLRDLGVSATNSAGLVVVGAVAAVLSLAAAGAFHRYVELPAMRRKRSQQQAPGRLLDPQLRRATDSVPA